MTIAIAVAVVITVAAALFYTFVISKPPSARFNGAAVVAAAQAYTRDLRARKQPVPSTVTLDELVTAHFLKPDEVAAFHGLNVTIMLTSDAGNPQAVIMRVHFPDGGDVVLLADGSVQQMSH
jgi:flagellar basal body-associated protein FliL